jgi:hypothetical protein
MTRREREQGLLRAWLAGELSANNYAWLWRSLDRYGRRWRLN